MVTFLEDFHTLPRHIVLDLLYQYLGDVSRRLRMMRTHYGLHEAACTNSDLHEIRIRQADEFQKRIYVDVPEVRESFQKILDFGIDRIETPGAALYQDSPEEEWENFIHHYIANEGRANLG